MTVSVGSNQGSPTLILRRVQGRFVFEYHASGMSLVNGGQPLLSSGLANIKILRSSIQAQAAL